MGRYKAPPRQAPIRNSLEHLNALRLRPEYSSGELIDESAAAAFEVEMSFAGQSTRKVASRRLRRDLYAETAARVADPDAWPVTELGSVMLSPELEQDFVEFEVARAS